MGKVILSLVAFLSLWGCATHAPEHAGHQMDAMTSGPERDIAAKHEEVTPYEDLKTQLEMKPGTTYLGFMLKHVNPELNKFQTAIEAEEKKFPRQYSKWQTDLIKNGEGVAIRIDKHNYIFNIGYRDGNEPQTDIKSGRSYGVGPTNKESDPSDVAYLKELSDYFENEPKGINTFFETILDALLDCDTSGWANLSKDGQVVATDFIAIYTAESDRHIMVDLKPRSHPWEIDLAAATFVSAHVAKAGTALDENGDFVEFEIKDWWAKGKVGSGIGETRRQRIALQKKIAENESDNKTSKAAVKKVEDVVGDVKDGDIIQAVFEYLNAPDGPKKMSEADRRKLKDGMLTYLDNVQSDAKGLK